MRQNKARYNLTQNANDPDAAFAGVFRGTSRPRAGLVRKGPRSGFVAVWANTADERRALRAVEAAEDTLRWSRRASVVRAAIAEALPLVQRLARPRIRTALTASLAAVGDRLSTRESPLFEAC